MYPVYICIFQHESADDNTTLRGYKFSNVRQKINIFMNTDDIKIFSKKKRRKEIEILQQTIIIHYEDIRMDLRIGKSDMRIIKNKVYR